MAVKIGELVIKANVESANPPSQAVTLSTEAKNNLIKQCVEQVLKTIEKERRR